MASSTHSPASEMFPLAALLIVVVAVWVGMLAAGIFVFWWLTVIAALTWASMLTLLAAFLRDRRRGKRWPLGLMNRPARVATWMWFGALVWIVVGAAFQMYVRHQVPDLRPDLAFLFGIVMPVYLVTTTLAAWVRRDAQASLPPDPRGDRV